MNELPKPEFLQKTLKEMDIGTYENVVSVGAKNHTVSRCKHRLKLLELFLNSGFWDRLSIES